MRDHSEMWQPLTAIEAQVASLVARLSYGDDWHFEMMRGDRCFVRITWAVRDLDPPPPRPLFDTQGQYGLPRSYRSGWTYLNSSVPVPDEQLGDHWLDVFLASLWDAIAELEGHERLERLRVDGVPVWSPHPHGEQQSAPGRVRSSPAGLPHTVRLAALPSPR